MSEGAISTSTIADFGGTRRAAIIHYRLFALLSDCDGCFEHKGSYSSSETEADLVTFWLSDVMDQDVNTDGWIFASLARALPDVGFYYSTDTDFDRYGFRRLRGLSGEYIIFCKLSERQTVL